VESDGAMPTANHKNEVRFRPGSPMRMTVGTCLNSVHFAQKARYGGQNGALRNLKTLLTGIRGCSPTSSRSSWRRRWLTIGRRLLGGMG